MLQVQDQASDIPNLEKLRYGHPHPKVMKKMGSLYLKGIGMSNLQICKILHITNNTLPRYFREYLEGGIEELKAVN